MAANCHTKKLQQSSITSHLRASIKKESKDDEDESGNEDMTNNQDLSVAFLCEFCDYTQSKRFTSRTCLINHCLKCHPTACLGCFEILASSEDLLQHLDAFPHEPPVCRNCCQGFESAIAKSNHKCATNPSSVNSAPLRINENLLRNCSNAIKTEPRESGSEKGYSDESGDADELETKYVPKETWGEDASFDEDDDDEEEDDYENEYLSTKQLPATSGPGLGSYGSWDVTLDCIHCKFSARGTERKPSIRNIRNHTFSVHRTACCICFEMFDNTEALNVHEESLQHKVYGCRACKLVYLRKSHLQRHVVKSHPEQCKIVCERCPARFFVLSQLKRHQREHRLEGNNELMDYQQVLPVNICTVCDYSAMSTCAIMMHMFDKHPEPNQIPKFKCDVCQIGFSRPNLFGKHILTKHLDDPKFREMYRQLLADYSFRFQCEVCKKDFSTRTKFIAHLRVIHPSSMPHNCSFCNLGFLDPTDLRMHEFREHMNTSPYVCEKCNKPWKNLSRLVNHYQRAHKMTTTPYVYCFIHNIGFCSNDNASTHYELKHKVRVKPEPQTFKCEICGKCLTTANGYANHQSLHKSELPFKCNICNKAYGSSASLQMHETAHSTRFQCDICGKTFHSQPFLKRHSVVHTGEKPFECSICGLKVSQKSALQRHLSKVHPGGITGTPRSTKPRKCRTLSKKKDAGVTEESKKVASSSASETKQSRTLSEEKNDEPMLQEAGVSKASTTTNPSAAPKNQKCRRVSKPNPERKVSVPAVKIDTWLLKADLRTKPKAILPAGARRQKRKRKPVSSEVEDDDDYYSSQATQTKSTSDAAVEGRPAKKRKCKSIPSNRYTLSSSDEAEKSSESDDESDESYVPNAKLNKCITESSNSRRSSRKMT